VVVDLEKEKKELGAGSDVGLGVDLRVRSIIAGGTKCWSRRRRSERTLGSNAGPASGQLAQKRSSTWWRANASSSA
jgi:hypothetical protein